MTNLSHDLDGKLLAIQLRALLPLPRRRRIPPPLQASLLPNTAKYAQKNCTFQPTPIC